MGKSKQATTVSHAKPGAARAKAAAPRAGAVFWGAFITQAAFVLTIALVVARCLIPQSETLREAFDVVPGGDSSPRGPGPTTSLVLDLLCCLPAILVLIRRCAERDYVVRVRLSHVLFGGLAVCAAASTLWAADKFAAAVTASHMIAAAALIWSTTQLVRSWLRLRLVAGVCFGLLLAYVVHGLVYRFVDSQDTARFWHEHKAEILRQHGWDEDSYSARQFEKKVMSREMMGFNQSPNSFAAVIVLLVVVSAGLAIQRSLNAPPSQRWWDGIAGAVGVFVTFLAAFLILYYTQSRTALGTLLIAAGMLAATGALRKVLGRRPGLAYVIGAAVVLVGCAAVVAHGMYNGSLPTDSLAFRWRYWVASARVFKLHPLLGVGWSNFGAAYLMQRLPIAAEEIRDPHNFLVRAFVELGLVGGVLLVAYLGRAAWELTRPTAPPISAKSSRQAKGAFGPLAIAVAMGILINMVASVDFSDAMALWRGEGRGAYLIIEVFRRLLWLGVVLIGAILVTVRSIEAQEADDRPAPWVLYAVLAGLAVFFVHNLVDFSLAEAGPLTLFAVLLGAALGVRTTWAATRQQGRFVPQVFLAAACVAWMAALSLFVFPVSQAEEQSQKADDAIREGKPQFAAGLLRTAYDQVPFNADYAYRSGRAALMAGDSAEKVRAMLDTAIARNPSAVMYYLTRARFEAAQPKPDLGLVRRDYDRALKLDPNNVEARLDFAEVLARLGDRMDAITEYGIALRKNNQLSPEEPKRLSPQKVDEVQEKLRGLTK